MKDIHEYGLLKDDEWEILPWICYDPRPPFRIWVTPEQISPFFIIDHHPYAISVLLKISDNFKADVFKKVGLRGSSEDWKTLAKKLIEEYEEENSGIDLFKFDCDKEIFCIFSEYVDDMMKFARDYLRPVCNDEKVMLKLLTGCRIGGKSMLTSEQVKEISRRLAEEKGIENDLSHGDIFSIVYHVSRFDYEDPSTDEHRFEIEYSSGDCFVITPGSPLFEYIRALCGLKLSSGWNKITLWKAE